MGRTAHLAALKVSADAGNAKELRSNMTDAEQALWYYLRARRFQGRKFRRQVPLGNYIVDFLCEEARVIVEVDGGQHAEQIERDAARTEWLRAEGYAVIRFWNSDVLENIEGVLATLSPALSQGRGRTAETIAHSYHIAERRSVSVIPAIMETPSGASYKKMSTAPPIFHRRRRWPWIVAILVLGAAVSIWWYFGSAKSQEAAAARRPAGAIPVVTSKSESRDIPVKLKSNGTVTAVQSVDLRAQITSTVKDVLITEGQNVHKGDLLFTLDSGTEEANLRKSLAQVEKDKADLSTADRNLVRQRDLFDQKFISQAALDTAQNQVDTLKGQLAIDTAAVEASRVARTYTEIRAPFAGRTGMIGARAGSLVQASNTAAAAPLVTVTQIDPITVAFTLPEKELGGLQQALAAGPVTVTAAPPAGSEPFKGKIIFVDNAVDTATGTIRVKAEFANPKAQLWPGMYVNVEVAPRSIANATVVPTQAVQTGPDNRFVYVVGEDKKIVMRPVTLDYVEEGFAVVTGIKAGERIVVEGAQNVRPGSTIAEADRSSPDATKTGTREGKKKGA